MILDKEQLNRAIKLRLQDALLIERAGLTPLLMMTQGLGHTESEMWRWLERPVDAPVYWLVTAARRLNISLEISGLMFGVPIRECEPSL